MLEIHLSATSLRFFQITCLGHFLSVCHTRLDQGRAKRKGHTREKDSLVLEHTKGVRATQTRMNLSGRGIQRMCRTKSPRRSTSTSTAKQRVELTAEWLKSVKGVVGSEDDIVKISRETLQQNNFLRVRNKSLREEFARDISRNFREQKPTPGRPPRSFRPCLSLRFQEQFLELVKKIVEERTSAATDPAGTSVATSRGSVRLCTRATSRGHDSTCASRAHSRTNR